MNMTALDNLLVFSLLSVLAVLLLGRQRLVGWMGTSLYVAQFALLMKLSGTAFGGAVIAATYKFEILGHVVSWRFDALSWYFAVITVGAAMLAACYSAGAWGDKYRAQGGSMWLLHLALSLNVFSMLLLLASGDLLSLFIGWELVSWASFLMMVLRGGAASRAALKYVTYAMAGAMAIFAGLVLVYQRAGSFQYSDVVAVVPSLSMADGWLLLALFGCGFAVKMGLLPFHLWQANAYAESPAPGAAFLGAISSRMGLYAIIVVLFQLIGMAPIHELKTPMLWVNAPNLIALIAAFTIIVPIYNALQQNDARLMLAWHGVGQGGYMIIGLITGDALGSAGGLMHVFSHATYQAVLFMSVFSVMHQTGTSDMNKLGGLIARMPFSYLAMLVGIIAMAGMPPMNGFVSKWMIYRSLILDGNPLMFVVSVAGTLGTILVAYKLIHNIFLGQLRHEHENVREVPWSMTAPMLILAALVFATGMFPGLVLEPVAGVQAAVGLPVINYTLGGVDMASGSLNMIWVCSILFGGFAVGALLFYPTGRTQHIHQLDNYAGGHFLTSETRYQYSDNFYAGLNRVIGPWYRYSFQWLESSLCSVTGTLGSGMKMLYRNPQPSFYLLAVVVIAMAWVWV